MAFKEKFLGQERPNTTDVHILYSSPEGTRTIVKHIQVANAGLSQGKVRVYLDNNGQSISGTLQINTSIPAGSSKSFPVFWVIEGEGSLMVQVFDSLAATSITAYGAEVTEE